jgi:putative DNA primase/helicase
MDSILLAAVDNWLLANPQGINPNREKIKEEIVNQTRIIIDMQNALLSKTTKMKVPDRLTNVQIARIIELVEPVVCISAGKDDDEETEFDLLGVYEYDGPNKGIYNTSEKALKQIIRYYNFAAVERDMEEVKQMLRLLLPRKRRCMDRDLIAVNNGIFDYKRKVLMPFTLDKIFLSKSRVNYNPNASNVTIHNSDDNTDWDVESWMSELSNDPGIVNLLWQILGAIIRPFVRWNKSAWLYSETGNSGKGTLCELMRNLCGRGSYASIALSDFSKDFMLEPLIHSNAIIVDENDVGIFLDKVANLKAVITNDVLLINRKFKKPVSYQFFGFMVQCLNEFPRIRDRSESLYRRQLFIPFDKCYTGIERPYIKGDYLSRPEVLEYVLFKVLNMNYYKLSEPAACKAMLDELKEANSPVREFVEDMLPQCQWDLLPFTFLYDLYKAWLAKVNPVGSALSRNCFKRELIAAVSGNPGWVYENKQVASKNRMDRPEPLILRYDLKDWKNPMYMGTDVSQICRPQLCTSYRGLQRKAPTTTVTGVLPSVICNGTMYSPMENTGNR